MTERIQWEKISKLPERNVPGDSEISMRNNTIVDVHRLIHLTERYPVVKRPIDTYLGRLEVDCWSDTKGATFTPRVLIDLIKEFGFDGVEHKFPKYSYHVKKIRDAEYAYPLHVYNGWVINGTHRLSKLTLMREMGDTTQDFITVKELSEIPQEVLVERNEKNNL